MTSDVDGRACEIRIDADRALVELIWTGRVDQERLAAAYEEIAAHPGWEPHFNRLSVFTPTAEVGEIDFAALDDIRAMIADWQDAHAPGQHVYGANVVETPFFDALAAVWEALSRDSESMTVRIFHNRDEALAWLDTMRERP